MPDLSHLWQRFLLAAALLFGLAVGVGATVFGYSNTAPVDVGWSIFHLHGIPLWSVVLVPLGVVLVAGTLFHWFNGLHHFSEHMRHRRRVHELEAEVTSLRRHLDELLQMPGHAETAAAESGEAPAEAPAEPPIEPATPSLAAASPEAVASNGEDRTTKKSRKRVSLAAEPEPRALGVATNGSAEPDKEPDTAPDVPPTAGS